MRTEQEIKSCLHHWAKEVERVVSDIEETDKVIFKVVMHRNGNIATTTTTIKIGKIKK